MSMQLAQAAFQRGDLALADRLLATHLAAYPRDAAAWHARGVVASARRDWTQAAAAFHKAIQAAGSKAPVDWHLALGNALLQAGRIDAALSVTARATRLAPKLPDAWFCHGLSLQAAGKATEAATAYEQCLRLNGDHDGARGNLALLLSGLGYYESAAEHLHRLVASGRAQPWHRINLAQLQLATGRTQAARAMLDGVTTHAESEEYQLVDAQLCLTEGRLDEARNLFRACLNRNPAIPDAQVSLAQLEQSEVERAAQLAQLDSVLVLPHPDWHRRVLLTARAILLEKLGQPQEAFATYGKAAQAGLAALRKAGRSYDRKTEEEFAGALIRAFPQARVIPEGPVPAPAGLVFIVGMPRSGTTLTEQMLARHPLVHGAGELPDADSVLLRARREGYPDLPAPKLQALAEDLRARFRKHLESHGKAVLVDKMPANYWHVGMLAAAFPQARFLHMIRDPADTCLSCWQQTFAFAMQPWQHDFDDLAHAHALKDRLMAHWQAILPDRIAPMRYEELVADPVGQSQRMAQFLGLDWRPEMADPSGATGRIATASVLQARKPVYTSSVGRLTKYGPGAQGLIDALKRAGLSGG